MEKDLALPAIAVIGDQSSGKSSVLEALSGVALPRGSGKPSFSAFFLDFMRFSLNYGDMLASYSSKGIRSPSIIKETLYLYKFSKLAQPCLVHFGNFGYIIPTVQVYLFKTFLNLKTSWNSGKGNGGYKYKIATQGDRTNHKMAAMGVLANHKILERNLT